MDETLDVYGRDIMPALGTRSTVERARLLALGEQYPETCLAEMIVGSKRVCYGPFPHHREGDTVGQAPLLVLVSAVQFQAS